MPAETRSVTFLRSSLSVRWNSVIFPINPHSFAKALDEEGFILAENFSRLSGHRDSIDVEAGILARKGSAAVTINPDRIYIGISSRDSHTLLSTFEEMENLVHTELRYPSQERAAFYEYLANILVPTTADAFSAWKRQYEGSKLPSRLSQLLGVNLSPLGIRLVSENSDPTDVDWSDFRIRPEVPGIHNVHNVTITMRRAQREPVMSFVSNIETTVAALVNYLEE